MDLGIYFKPIKKIESSKNTIGSIIDAFNFQFPDWQSSDIVFLTVLGQISGRYFTDKSP